MMGSSDQVLPLTDDKVILYPLPESLVVHGVDEIPHVIRCAVCGDQFDPFDRKLLIQGGDILRTH
ncbi:MAG: hypothetical protein IKN25_06265, partial [Spirochaetales bacterium]|nr:hypothetical protein [Spirochaetales bacterium]